MPGKERKGKQGPLTGKLLPVLTCIVSGKRRRDGETQPKIDLSLSQMIGGEKVKIVFIQGPISPKRGLTGPGEDVPEWADQRPATDDW